MGVKEIVFVPALMPTKDGPGFFLSACVRCQINQPVAFVCGPCSDILLAPKL